MSVCFFYHHEENNMPQSLEMVAKMTCQMYNYDLLMIDKVGDLMGNPMAFASIDEAMNDLRFKDYSWVFLDAKGEKYLHEYAHPKDNVAYMVGSDKTGFDKSVEEYGGEVLKLKSATGTEYFGLVALTAVANHRFFQIEANR